MTAQGLAKLMRLTRERIRQIEEAACRKLALAVGGER